jgi:hypothetical protein
MPSPDTHRPPPWCPGFLPLPLLSQPPLDACDSLTWPLPLTHWFPAQHTYTLFPCLFWTRKNAPFQGLINSCFCLLLIRSVVMWEPSNVILSHGQPMGTETHSSISFLLPI